MHISSSDLPDRCFVYGGGTFGTRLHALLLESGIDVVARLDHHDRPQTMRPDEAHEALPVVLGVCNPEVNLTALEESLATSGLGAVISPVEAVRWLGLRGVRLENYWLTSDPDVLDRSATDIERTRGLLADEQSTSLLDQIVSYRRFGALGVAPSPCAVSRQYLGDGLRFIQGPVRLVDGGAFTGDTVRNLLGAGIELESVLAFEPDRENFRALTTELQRIPVDTIALPLALSAVTAIMRFDDDATAAAHLSEHGNVGVQAVALDDVSGSWRPTHIKLDIEGAEPDALTGMRRTLERDLPALAISVYHRPDHLWTIPQWIASTGLPYDLHLRCYGQQTFDTVLYAVPSRGMRGSC